MALNFPDSPTNGQIFSSGTKKWIWSDTEGAWLASNYAPSPENVNGIVKCNGAGNNAVYSAAVPGTDYLTSANLVSSPAAAKAWACFTMRYDAPTNADVNFTGTQLNIEIYDQYNISAINLLGRGRVELVFLTPMPNRAYSVICQCAENVTGGYQAGGSVASAGGVSNSDFPTTQPSPNFTSADTSGKTTAKVKVGFGNVSQAFNPTECYVHIFSS